MFYKARGGATGEGHFHGLVVGGGGAQPDAERIPAHLHVSGHNCAHSILQRVQARGGGHICIPSALCTAWK